MSGRREMVELLRQRSRPYLFSNSLAPMVAATTLAVLELLTKSTELRDRLEENARLFRGGDHAAGFDVKPGSHPIVPIMLFEENRAAEMARRLLDEGIYVIGFSYPGGPRRARRASASSSPPCTRGRTCSRRSALLYASGARAGDRRREPCFAIIRTITRPHDAEDSMVKAEDKSKIQSLISDLNGLKSRDPQESKFKEWKDKAERNVEEVFGKGSDQAGRFQIPEVLRLFPEGGCFQGRASSGG